MLFDHHRSHSLLDAIKRFRVHVEMISETSNARIIEAMNETVGRGRLQPNTVCLRSLKVWAKPISKDPPRVGRRLQVTQLLHEAGRSSVCIRTFAREAVQQVPYDTHAAFGGQLQDLHVLEHG